MTRTLVLLAAGRGSRFNHLSFAIPKALIRYYDRPLIDLSLQNIADNLPQVDRTIVITGYKREILEEYVKLIAPSLPFDLVCVRASEYKQGNGKSLSAAEPYVDDHFYLTMCDHLLDKTMYHSISDESNGKTDLSLCIDCDPGSNIQMEDATKVLTDTEGNILQIGKGLKTWTAIDTGLFYLSTRIFKRIRQVPKKFVTVSDAVMQMISCEDCVKGVDVSGSFWADIDTFSDLRTAELQYTPYVTSFLSTEEVLHQSIDRSFTSGT